MRRTAVALTAMVMTLTGCGGSTQKAQPAVTSTTSLLPTTTTTAGSSPTTAAGATTSTAASSGLPVPVGTQPYKVERSVKVPPAAKLTAVRAGTQDGFDRVVFDFAGALPGTETVSYVAGLSEDGSGAPVTVRGTAYLKVVFSVAEAHNVDGTPSFPQGRRVDPGLAAVKEVALLGDYEGYVSFGLGLVGKVGFRVFELSNPSRVVIDVARTP